MACQEHTARALQLSLELLKLADEPQDDCQHDECLVLNGVLRDCAWKVRNFAIQWSRQLELLEKMKKDGPPSVADNDSFRTH